MIKNHRKQYLELNSIPDTKKRILAGNFLQKHPKATIRAKHKYATLIKHFQLLLNNQIDKTAFFCIGDGQDDTEFITHDHTLYDRNQLTENASLMPDYSLIVIHTKAAKHAEKVGLEKRQQTVKTLKQKKCLLLEIENI